MKKLEFWHHGNHFVVSLSPKYPGHVMKYDEHTFKLPHESWRIIGFSRHHWKNSPDYYIRDLINQSSEEITKKIRKTLVWDVDHGTTRLWGGRHYGKIPRVESPSVSV